MAYIIGHIDSVLKMLVIEEGASPHTYCERG